MQISNPVLSQFIGTTFNRDQQANQFPAKPVTIEGQVVAEDEAKKRNSQAVQQDGSGNETSDSFVLENEQQLIRPVAESNQSSDASLIQKGPLENDSILLNTAAQTASSEQGFSFGNRRSFNGLAGNNLIIQNYLNNTPEQFNRSSGNTPNLVDYFV